MSDDQYEKLDNIGFCWESPTRRISKKRKQGWDDMFETLLRYQVDNGNCHVIPSKIIKTCIMGKHSKALSEGKRE